MLHNRIQSNPSLVGSALAGTVHGVSAHGVSAHGGAEYVGRDEVHGQLKVVKEKTGVKKRARKMASTEF